MEYYEVKEWLDNIVNTIRKQHQNEVLTSSIKIFPVDDKCQMHCGLNIVSDVMRLPISAEERKEGDGYVYKYRYSIVYRGVEFFQLENNPLEGGCYANV